MGYLKFIFKTSDSDLLTGVLSQFDFEAFSEENNDLAAWVDERVDRSSLAHDIELKARAFYTSFEIEHIPDQNWNAVWESSFDPVAVDDFCLVRANFHDPKPGFQYEVVIDPKQAFGTGHHETTYMMIESMRDMQFEGKRILDLGCGTGILAILAAKMGAEVVTAIDIEEESVENTVENLNLNSVSADVRHGSVEVVAGEKYDMILANINRNTIMFLMHDITSLLSPGAAVVFSGFLEHNFEEVCEKAESLGLRFVERRQRGEWECVLMNKE